LAGIDAQLRVNYNSHMRSRCHLFFETLGNKLKIDIILKLKEGPLSVNELAEKIGQERSSVSHALISFSDCGFARAKNDGKKRIYSLNKETILPLLDLVERHIKKYCKVCRKQNKKRDKKRKL